MVGELSCKEGVGGVGFEPTKAEPTVLQTVPFVHSGILPDYRLIQYVTVELLRDMIPIPEVRRGKYRFVLMPRKPLSLADQKDDR